MSNINATNFRANLYEYLDMAVSYGDVINISTKNGNAVVISEDDYKGFLETIYLSSIPGMEEKLVKGKNESIDECEDFEW